MGINDPIKAGNIARFYPLEAVLRNTLFDRMTPSVVNGLLQGQKTDTGIGFCRKLNIDCCSVQIVCV